MTSTFNLTAQIEALEARVKKLEAGASLTLEVHKARFEQLEQRIKTLQDEPRGHSHEPHD